MKTISELVVEGFSEGGFRAEHALAMAMADASPALKAACENAIRFAEASTGSTERDVLLLELRRVVATASTPASRAAH